MYLYLSVRDTENIVIDPNAGWDKGAIGPYCKNGYNEYFKIDPEYRGLVRNKDDNSNFVHGGIWVMWEKEFGLSEEQAQRIVYIREGYTKEVILNNIYQVLTKRLCHSDYVFAFLLLGNIQTFVLV